MNNAALAKRSTPADMVAANNRMVTTPGDERARIDAYFAELRARARARLVAIRRSRCGALRAAVRVPRARARRTRVVRCASSSPPSSSDGDGPEPPRVGADLARRSQCFRVAGDARDRRYVKVPVVRRMARRDIAGLQVDAYARRPVHFSRRCSTQRQGCARESAPTGKVRPSLHPIQQRPGHMTSNRTSRLTPSEAS
jgi:hypothetical protein